MFISFRVPDLSNAPANLPLRNLRRTKIFKEFLERGNVFSRHKNSKFSTYPLYDSRALEFSVLEGRCRFSPKGRTEIEYLG